MYNILYSSNVSASSIKKGDFTLRTHFILLKRVLGFYEVVEELFLKGVPNPQAALN